MRRPIVVPVGENQRWSLDFISEAHADGRWFRSLALENDHAHENLALIADTTLSRISAMRELDRDTSERGRLGTIISDKGTEFNRIAIPPKVKNKGSAGIISRRDNQRKTLTLIFQYAKIVDIHNCTHWQVFQNKLESEIPCSPLRTLT